MFFQRYVQMPATRGTRRANTSRAAQRALIDSEAARFGKYTHGLPRAFLRLLSCALTSVVDVTAAPLCSVGAMSSAHATSPRRRCRRRQDTHGLSTGVLSCAVSGVPAEWVAPILPRRHITSVPLGLHLHAGGKTWLANCVDRPAMPPIKTGGARKSSFRPADF